MDIAKVLTELRAERALLDEVITSLEKLSGGQKRRGRPRGSRNRIALLPAHVAMIAQADEETGRSFAAWPA